LTENKYTFSVVRDNGTFTKTGQLGIPLTLLGDANGNIEFEKEGGESHLMEPFTWRLEAMRNTLTNEPASKGK